MILVDSENVTSQLAAMPIENPSRQHSLHNFCAVMLDKRRNLVQRYCPCRKRECRNFGCEFENAVHAMMKFTQSRSEASKLAMLRRARQSSHQHRPASLLAAGHIN
jgi:hypothetical protein